MDSVIPLVVAKLQNDARNQLHSVMAMLELIAEGPLTEAQYECLATCRSSADRLLLSVENVCQFLNPAAAPLEREFDLHDVVTEVTSLMEALARRKGLSFTAVIHPHTPRRVLGDRYRMEDILVRLLDNAIRYTERGGIEVLVTASSSADAACAVELTICDTGSGIAPQVMACVFESSMAERVAETGLGLPIARKMALEMGGDLSIESQETGGTRIRVSIPLKRVEACLTAATEQAIPVPDRSDAARPLLNLLVAEDSDDSYDVIESYLAGGEEYRLNRASDGAAAVEMFKAGNFDLVLIDIHMPVMDGYSATRAIREWETTSGRPRTPIVVLSSDSPETQIQNGAKVGCSGYLTKPASKAAVLNALRRYSRLTD